MLRSRDRSRGFVNAGAHPAATVPDAPTIGTATAGDSQAVVTFTAPANDGGSVITGYTATSTPGGLTVTGSGSPLTVTGLTNGTAYTFTVHATNSVGNSEESAATAAVTPAVPVYGAAADTGQVNSGDTFTGNKYFFDYTLGSDANTGLVEASPAKTLLKLLDYTVTGGSLTAPADSGMLLKRGETFYGAEQFNSFISPSFVGNFLSGAYGTGARPVVEFDLRDVGYQDNYAAVFSQRLGPRLKNSKVDVKRSVAATFVAGTGTFAYGDVVTGVTSGNTGIVQAVKSDGTRIILQCTSAAMFTSGEVIQTSGAAKTGTISAFSSITGCTFSGGGWTVENAEIVNALGNGILISVLGNNATINNSTMSNCCSYQANGAGIDGGLGSGITITNNTVFDCGNGLTSHNIYVNDLTNSTIARNWSYMNSNKGNHALIIHGLCSDVLIEGNLFEYCNNGIGINDGYSTAEGFTRFTIRRNINRQHGKRAGQTQGQAAELSCLVDSALYNNLHYECNLQYGLTAKRASGGADLNSANVTISHETIHNVTGGLTLTSAMSGIVVQNCIFSSTAASGYLINIAALSVAGLTLRNCLFYMPNNTGNAIMYNGTGYTIAAFLAGPGAGMGHVAADPLFVNAATGDFRLQVGSPAKLAGCDAGIDTDFAGNARHATTPSIGAFE